MIFENRNIELAYQMIRELHPSESYFYTKEASVIIRVQVNTMNIWRSQGRGPTYCRNGTKGRITYSIYALAEFMAASQIVTA